MRSTRKAAKYARLTRVVVDGGTKAPQIRNNGLGVAVSLKKALPYTLEEQALALVDNLKRLRFKMSRPFITKDQATKYESLVERTEARLASIVTQLKTEGREIYA